MHSNGGGEPGGVLLDGDLDAVVFRGGDIRVVGEGGRFIPMLLSLSVLRAELVLDDAGWHVQSCIAHGVLALGIVELLGMFRLRDARVVEAFIPA